MGVVTQRIGWTVLALAVAVPAGARTDCDKDATAACVELASHVGQYDRLLWAVCAGDSETVCKCWNAQQRSSGVDWCQWANCACGALTDATYKQGICGLSTACGSIALLKQQGAKLAEGSAASQLAAQAERVRDGAIVECSPQACMAVGPECARVVGALAILKDSGKIRDRAGCLDLARTSDAFAQQVHIAEVTPAIAACACAAAF